jgi:uncharacterized protein YwqG
MFHTKDDIRDDIIKAGIPADSADLLARQAKPAIWLETQTVEDEAAIPVGATKLGGRPDLPAGVAWPVRPAWPDAEKRTERYRKDADDPDTAWSWAKPEERLEFRDDALKRIRLAESSQPLAFLAQINFADMWAAGELDPDMPQQGILSIFYDLYEQAWGFDPQDRTGVAILFHDAAQTLTRHEMPDELQDDDITLSPLACTAHACMTPLAIQTAHYKRIIEPNLPDDDADQLWDDWLYGDESKVNPSTDGQDWACHHVGGWPTPVQDDMQTECALVQAGHYCGDSTAYEDPALAPIRDTATDWLLLAQIGSDEKGGVMWGDAGQLYLWIQRDDLKARRFENARLILQCH